MCFTHLHLWLLLWFVLWGRAGGLGGFRRPLLLTLTVCLALTPLITLLLCRTKWPPRQGQSIKSWFFPVSHLSFPSPDGGVGVCWAIVKTEREHLTTGLTPGFYSHRAANRRTIQRRLNLQRTWDVLPTKTSWAKPLSATTEQIRHTPTSGLYPGAALSTHHPHLKLTRHLPLSFPVPPKTSTLLLSSLHLSSPATNPSSSVSGPVDCAHNRPCRSAFSIPPRERPPPKRPPTCWCPLEARASPVPPVRPNQGPDREGEPACEITPLSCSHWARDTLHPCRFSLFTHCNPPHPASILHRMSMVPYWR